jgi:hypothetical protein
MRSKRLATMLLSGAAVVGLGNAVSNASLFLELRASTVDAAHASQVIFTPGSKSFQLGTGAFGATLTMVVVGKVTGADADQSNDGILSLTGSFLSTHGAAGHPSGNMTATRQVSTTGLNQTSGFNGAGSTNGNPSDLNGDGDLDVGSNHDNDAAGFWAVRATSAPDPVFATAAPFELQLGTVRYVWSIPVSPAAMRPA